LSTLAGDITVLIPSNLAVSVMATNQSGGMRRIISDFSEVRVKNAGLLQLSAPRGEDGRM
jgi:predicted membrane protein